MINGKTVMGITLARGGSKGIPQKNVIDVMLPTNFSTT